MLHLYGHPFSSYTWKAQIALHTAAVPYELMVVAPDQPDNMAFVAAKGGPLALFPVLRDGDETIFEATSIIEHLAACHPAADLIPSDPAEARTARNLDRVFDNYVMTPMQGVVAEYIRAPASVDAERCDEGRKKLRRAYDWLENRLVGYRPERVTIVECAAAPSLFYADWVEPIGEERPRLAGYRSWLLAQPEVVACVEAARPFRHYFPPGAPDRD